jgi:hypothetical protein
VHDTPLHYYIHRCLLGVGVSSVACTVHGSEAVRSACTDRLSIIIVPELGLRNAMNCERSIGVRRIGTPEYPFSGWRSTISQYCARNQARNGMLHVKWVPLTAKFGVPAERLMVFSAMQVVKTD